MHQPDGLLQQEAVVNSSASSASAGTAKTPSAVEPKAEATAATTGSTQLEPATLVDAQEAVGCNVIEVFPKAAQPLSPQLLAAAQAAAGNLTCTLALHLPQVDSVQQVVCAGACIQDNQLVWKKGCRAFMTCKAVQALKVCSM